MTGTVVAPSGAQSELLGSGVDIDYVEATQSYTLTASTGETVTFTPAEKNDFLAYPELQWSKTVGSAEDQLLLMMPGTTGPMRYVASGVWTTVDAGPAGSKVREFVTGVPTLPSDMPLSGTADYYFRTLGAVTDNGTSYSLYLPETSVTFSANFATGAIATSLHLVGRSGGSSVDLGTYTGTGAIASGSPGFSGTLLGAGRTGGFSGAFFGPQAVEVGYAWYLSGTGFTGQGVGVGLSKPAATQAYDTLDELSGDQIISTAGITFKGSPAAPTDRQTKLLGSGYSITYSADSDSYTLQALTGETATLGPADQVSSSGLPAGVARWQKTSGTLTDIFTLIRPGVNGTVLNYTMIGNWTQLDSGPGDDKYHYSIGGIPTGLDMPTTGTATYSFVTGGTVQSGGTSYIINDGTPNATFSANFGTGAITTTLTLVGQPTGGGSDTALGTFTGAGLISTGSSAFSGTLTGSGDRTGGFTGSFFGPAAAEVGYAWEAHGTNFEAQGVGAGKKD